MTAVIFSDGVSQGDTFVVELGALVVDNFLQVKLIATALQTQTYIGIGDGKLVIQMTKLRKLQDAKNFLRSIAPYLTIDVDSMLVMDVCAAEALNLVARPTMPADLLDSMCPELPVLDHRRTTFEERVRTYRKGRDERNAMSERLYDIESRIDEKKVKQDKALVAWRKDEERATRFENRRAMVLLAGLEVVTFPSASTQSASDTLSLPSASTQSASSALSLPSASTQSAPTAQVLPFALTQAVPDVLSLPMGSRPEAPKIRWFGLVPSSLTVYRALKMSEARRLQWTLARLESWGIPADDFLTVVGNFKAFLKIAEGTFTGEVRSARGYTAKAIVAVSKALYVRWAALRNVELQFPPRFDWQAYLTLKEPVDIRQCRKCYGQLSIREVVDNEAMQMRHADLGRDRRLAAIWDLRPHVLPFQDEFGLHNAKAANDKILELHAERLKANCCKAVPYMLDGKHCEKCKKDDANYRAYDKIAKQIDWGYYTWSDCESARRVVDRVLALPAPMMTEKFCPTCSPTRDGPYSR